MSSLLFAHCYFLVKQEPTHVFVVQALLDSGTFQTDEARSEAVEALKSLAGQ
jgi:hypothetical protein